MDVNCKPIKNQVDLSLKLAKHVFSIEAVGDSNLVLSPLSINAILSLIAAGSDSPTRDQLLAFLNSDSTDDLNTFYSQIVGNILADSSLTGGPCLSVANGLWIGRTLPLKPSFKHVVDNVYKGATESVDFQNKCFTLLLLLLMGLASNSNSNLQRHMTTLRSMFCTPPVSEKTRYIITV
ncbi:PREDICTED: serpin-ZX-like [Ipomoea nil]|uniref:serpin-ZX-like n=1 Tax=Ipomoea nil TaxID=35883 RepID=UPI0009016F1B|nr:PREDICTED: serpin-ZX-like [Ipomoea nil]